jgi:hypothetical protein
MLSINYNELFGFGFYYLIFVIIIFFSLIKLNGWITRIQLIRIIGIALVLIAAFRAVGIDKDYTTYQNSFSIVKAPLDYFYHYSDWSYFEPFYYLIPSSLKLLSIPFYEGFLFLIFAIIGVGVNCLGIKKLNGSGLNVLIYFSFFFFLHEMTQIRVGIACGGLLIGAYFYYNKQYKYFFYTVVLSACFQYTGILILLILILSRDKFRLSVNLILLLTSFFCVLLRINVIDEFLFVVKLPFTEKLMLTLKTLTKKENELNAFNIPYLLNFLFTIWLFINHKKIKEKNKYAYLLLKIQLISFICFGIFSSVAVMAFRFYEFFGIASILTTSYFIYTIRYKIVGYLVVATYSLLIMINMLHITKLVNPYDLIFFQY